MTLEVSRWSSEEIVEAAVSADEREWVSTANPLVWVRPLLFDTVRGAWVNVTRIRTTGFITRHAHPCPVHAYVIKGQWQYAERDWPATAGDYVFEPPGDIHTLTAQGDESLTMFWITGTLVELDEEGNTTGYADVFTRIAQAEAHYERVGLGADHVKRYIR
jgi:2,4'-dihydroxyacetophenone dioxygenase